MEDLVSLNALQENEKITSAMTDKILIELVDKLSQSQDNLELVKKRNLPKIEEIRRIKREIMKEMTNLKEELTELNEIQPTKLLERRQNDFKTEGEYISKILNRNIEGEFILQMKRELKNLVTNLTDPIKSSELDPIKTITIPGCDELNEKLDELGIEGISVSQRTEKLLFTINKCYSEILNKVYKVANDDKDSSDNREKRIKFEEYCVEMINLYFKRKMSTGVALPQFIVLLLNDLTFSSIFISIHFRSSANNYCKFIQKMRRECYEKFVKDQEEEISSLLIDFKVKSVKKVNLFLSRLSKVMSPFALKSDLLNLQYNLINFAQERAWMQIQNLEDVSEDEIDGIIEYLEEIIQLSQSFSLKEEFGELLFSYEIKLKSTIVVLKSSLIEIINYYRQGQLKSLNDSNLANLLSSIFASSPLRNEFIKELGIGNDRVGDSGDEEYF